MYIFTSPPPTRLDLNFTIAGIPVRVHPLFWLIAAFLGSTSGGIINLLVWVLVVFVSILIHEFGHAIAFKIYGLYSRVVLYMAGGLTIPETVQWGSRWASVSLSPIQEIVISFSGPLAGFLFTAITVVGVKLMGGLIITTPVLGIIPLPLAVLPINSSAVHVLFNSLFWVNIFWGVFNLMPVYPLDGGSITRNLLILADPSDGLRKSRWVSTIAGAVIALAGLIFMRSIYIGLLFGYLAYRSYRTLQGGAGRSL